MQNFEECASKLINNTYVRQGLESMKLREEKLTRLIAERRLPDEGWDETLISYALSELSSMDSNNFRENIGVGEREGRIYSPIVYRRHFGLTHGIGRSGDIAEVQPKAGGSSIISKITSELALHALHFRGLKSLKSCLVVPIATGMSIMLCLSTLKNMNPTGKYVIWLRIDQKSCFKGILTAGCTPLVVEPLQVDDELRTNTEEIEILIQRHRAEILCVLSTTSCFAPRTPDTVDVIAKLCRQYDTAHVINNAYGVQCQYITRLIERAMTVGRVDYIVQSTDKNFLVPVGGALVASPSESAVRALSKMYPGRASASPIIDLFITLLAMGKTGLCQLWRDRETLLPHFIDHVQAVAASHRQRVLLCPHNSISIAVSLSYMVPGVAVPWSYLGSMLFKRLVSGSRVVTGGESSTIGGVSFEGWGAHTPNCHTPYLTAACAVGASRAEIDMFCRRLDKVFIQFGKQLYASRLRQQVSLRAEANADPEQQQSLPSVTSEAEEGSLAAAEDPILHSVVQQLSDLESECAHVPAVDGAQDIASAPLSSQWLDVYMKKKIK